MFSFPIPGRRRDITSDACCNRHSRTSLRSDSHRAVICTRRPTGKTTRRRSSSRLQPSHCSKTPPTPTLRVPPTGRSPSSSGAVSASDTAYGTSFSGARERLKPAMRKLRRRIATAIAAPLTPKSLFPAGHFYSPIVDVDELRAQESRVWPAGGKVLGTDFNALHPEQVLREYF